LVIAPSAASHSQSIPTAVSYSSSPWRQISANTPARSHSWKRRCAELDEQTPVASSAFHCIPVRSTNKIASIARRFGTRGRWHPSGCDGGAGNNGSIRSHNQSGIRQPSSRLTNPIINLPIEWHDGRPIRRFDARYITPTGLGP
jgi:hypothetical protein